MTDHLKVQTECALCCRTLKLSVIHDDIPDFCSPCYMSEIHPKVEQMIRDTPAGQRIPEHSILVKLVLSMR